MRVTYVLLFAAAALVATGNALSTEVDAEKRLLRSHKEVDDYDAQVEEERGLNFFEKLNLPQMFKKMNDLPEHQRYIFSSWMGGMKSVDDAVEFMKSQGLKGNALEHFKVAYADYRASHF